jgi:hypothetical protein
MARHILAAAFGQGGKFPTIGCVNLATVPLGVDYAKLIVALQKYLDEHVVPIWGYPAKLVSYPNIAAVPADQWQLLFLDDADAANALGYHDLTKNGQPVSKIFVKTTIADGEKVSVTASHELAEMLLDPGAQLWAQKPDGSFVAYELSDPVEEQTFDIDGIAMSNFVYPSYFESFKHPKGAKFDHLGKVKGPFQITKGGYLIVAKGGKVDEVFGSLSKGKRFQKEHRYGHRSEYRKPAAQLPARPAQAKHGVQ